MRYRYTIFGAMGWILLVIASALWNIRQSQQAHDQVNLDVARSFFELIVTMRQWNAELGGVYAPVSATLQPNPYLSVPDREVQLADGRIMTKINPAYMTRLVSELAEQHNQVQFHITSLHPVNPANAATAWETAALQAFEEQAREIYSWDRERHSFIYMAPLVVEPSCMICHEQHGYQMGDIRGGISVSFAVQPVPLGPVVLTYGFLALVGLIAISYFGWQAERSFSQMSYQSNIDALTGLYNRRYFDQYLAHALAEPHCKSGSVALILGDVDNFKAYNDYYGHQAGDHCLHMIAGALHRAIRRNGDIVARYGGEEFALVLPHTSAEDALVVAERARQAVLALQISNAATGIPITLSLGVAVSACEQPPADLINQADQALYRAKQAGKNCVRANG
ncbi:MAG: diguanylate cyclase domain-containing protein [Oscillochloridaceae bacterium umkhey_bin13]